MELKTTLAVAAFGLLNFGILTAETPEIIVQSKDGTEQTTAISEIGKISFANSSLVVTLANNQSKTYSLESIKKLYFKNAASSSVDDSPAMDAKELFIAYPNPSNSIISLKGTIAQPTNYSIYDLSGNKVKSGVLSASGEQINIEELSIGTYIININNHNVKFDKYEK